MDLLHVGGLKVASLKEREGESGKEAGGSDSTISGLLCWRFKGEEFPKEVLLCASLKRQHVCQEPA